MWDNFQGSDDHIVPAPDQQSRESAWSRGLHQEQRDNKKKRFFNEKQQQQGKQHSIISTITSLAAAVAAASQQSLGSSTTFSNSSEEEEGNSLADSWAGRFSGSMLQTWPSVAPVMWNEVINGADFSATKVAHQHQHQHQHQNHINNNTFSPLPMLSGWLIVSHPISCHLITHQGLPMYT